MCTNVNVLVTLEGLIDDHAMAGMGNESLYRVSYTGTKDLIVQYIEEVVYQLEHLSQTSIPGWTILTCIS